MNLREEVQKWLSSSINDPIAKILMKNSNLTRAQTETLIIDILSEKIAEKRITYEEKAKLRLLGSGVSRGAFNKTLKQARKNVIRSVYTVSLLGYLGMLESPRLEPYLELANKLHTFTDAYRKMMGGAGTRAEHLRVINMLQRQLEDGLKKLVEPKAMSARM